MRPIFGSSKKTGRCGPKRASALALGACLALSGCYQVLSGLDPANWAKKAREGIPAMAEPEARKHDARADPPTDPPPDPPPDAVADAVASEIPPLAADAEYDIVTREKLAAVPAPADPAPPPRTAAMEPPKAKPAGPQTAPAQVTARAQPVRRQSADPPYAVHITSYKKRSNVGKDWKRLVGAHPEQLMGLRVRVTPIDLGPPRGRFYRLKAGPLPSRQFANDLCRSLRQRGLYCAVKRFTGQPPT